MKIYQTLIKRALKPQVPSLSEVGSLILQGDSMSVTQSFIASATHLVGELWRVESPRDGWVSHLGREPCIWPLGGSDNTGPPRHDKEILPSSALRRVLPYFFGLWLIASSLRPCLSSFMTHVWNHSGMPKVSCGIWQHGRETTSLLQTSPLPWKYFHGLTTKTQRSL